MQDSKRDTDIKNRLLDSVGEGEGELGARWVDSRESSLLRRLERGREIGLEAMPRNILLQITIF